MARKKKQQQPKLKVLPTTIELISNRTGVVREFNTDHAFRLLRLQKNTGLGSYEIYNTHLYTYEDTGIKFTEPEQPIESNPTG
jgi:hypothetical protein